AEEADAVRTDAASLSDPLDLGAEYVAAQPASSGDAGGNGAGEGGDELLLDASRLAETNEPFASPLVTRKRPLVSGDSLGEGGAGGGASQGSTLFERMANLSRGRAAATEEEEEDDGGSI